MNDLNAQNIRQLKANQRRETDDRYGYNSVHSGDLNDDGKKVDRLILFDNEEGTAYGLDPHIGGSAYRLENLESLTVPLAWEYVSDLIGAIHRGELNTFATWDNLNAPADKATKGGSIIGSTPEPVTA